MEEKDMWLKKGKEGATLLTSREGIWRGEIVGIQAWSELPAEEVSLRNILLIDIYIYTYTYTYIYIYMYIFI